MHYVNKKTFIWRAISETRKGCDHKFLCAAIIIDKHFLVIPQEPPSQAMKDVCESAPCGLFHIMRCPDARAKTYPGVTHIIVPKWSRLS
jgi:hypothetical protein